MGNIFREVMGKFLQHITHNLIFPVTDQECCGEGKDFWCADWWTIEVAKYLFEGKTNYSAYDPPRRLEGNCHFSKNNIITDGEVKEKVYDHLKRLKDDAESILIGEVGRGLDIVVAELVKQWKTIYCYDSNYRYEKYLKELWGDRVDFLSCPTVNFDPSYIKEKVIVVVNHSKEVEFKSWKESSNFVHIIVNGNLLERI